MNTKVNTRTDTPRAKGRTRTQIGIPAPAGRAAAVPLGIVWRGTGYYTRGVRARGLDAVRIERLGKAGVGKAARTRTE